MEKTTFKPLNARFAALCSGVALLSSALLASAQDYVVDNFDADPSGAWVKWWGSAEQTYEFDPSVDAGGNANSGALKATIGFDLASFAGDNQFAVRRDFPNADVLDGTKYTNLVFDLRWDPSSPKTGNGDFGYLEYGFRNSDWSQTGLGGMNVPTTPANGWIHVVAPIAPTAAKLDTISGVYFKVWSGGTGGLTGTSLFWVDNVKLIANTNTVTPPPQLSLERAVPGLQLTASAAGQQYQRQNIRTLATDADGNPLARSWVGSSQPVTYSFTVQDFPDAAHNGFQAHLFLVPEANMPYGPNDNSIDWNASNVIFVQLANNADGSATAAFMYKTNLPGGNTMFWNSNPTNGPVGRLATVTDPSAKGTWSVSFKNNTSVTLTTPSGTSTNFSLPSDAASLFADPVDAYFGVQPNNNGNIGQSVHLSRIQINGLPNPVDESFSGSSLDTAKWQVVAADATGIQVVPPDAAYWAKWTAPATGFTLQTSSSLKPGSWTDPGLTNVVQLGSQKAVVVPKTALPSPNQGSFRLSKP